MIRVLHILSSMNVGGVETFIMKVYRSVDKSKVQFDFLLSQFDSDYKDEIQSLGGNIYVSQPKLKHPFNAFLDIKRIVKENNYNVIFRSSNDATSLLHLFFAKLGGAELLIMRSPTSRFLSQNIVVRIAHFVFRPLLKYIAHILLAPSTEAGLFMFGKKGIKSDKFFIIKNGLNLANYDFDKLKRDTVRQSLDINDEFVVGHVGRLSKVKNHKYLLEVFFELLKRKSDSILILVGKGEEEINIKNQAMSLGIYKQIRFCGLINDITPLLSAMDVFVFPSFFEGLPNAVIEASATGLPCFVSDTISPEVKTNDLVEFLSINAPASVWADKILPFSNGYLRNSKIKEMNELGYDINKSAQKLVELYLTTEKN